MKRIYLEPTMRVVKISTGATMITGSVGGNKILRSGGTTEDGSITESDARRGRFSTWEDDGE